MESINSLKNAATRAIWGDEQAHQEPVSGVKGDVAKGEPYDAGNMGEPEEAKDKLTAPDETGTQPVETNLGQQPKPSTETKTDDKTPTVNPTQVKDSSTAPGDHSYGQNDVRDPAEPATHPDETAAKHNVDDTDGLDVNDNPDKLEGPGPRPLEQVAKEHGGDAGKSGSDSSVNKTSLSKADTVEDDHHDSGTGELYVRSSGLKADGGDFDAAKPGAGREADRLLEEKGVSHGANGGIVPNEHAVGSANGSANGNTNGAPKEKTSLKTKIKAKLHRSSVTASS
ncbi:hypothetical protein OQA88_219 [Cercophora sp. LCS_1]